VAVSSFPLADFASIPQPFEHNMLQQMYRLLNQMLANILNPKPDGFPLLTFTLTPYVSYCLKGGSEIQFVADLLNINPIVTFTINPPLLTK